ncbi:MAG: hypothetical protein RMJ67_06380 [Elusimicrobiota bacterium]|nr:hypothetical protein [Endomicrobiia bacterium]MDW8166120.1 hypothetical protein [Elusimicrobiota bacterium]
MIIDDILNKYQELVGLFIQAKPILLRIKREIILKKQYHYLLNKVEKLLIDYEPLFKQMVRLLSSISKIKEGKGKEVNITQLVSDFISFSSKANNFIKEVFEIERTVFGTSRLRTIYLIHPFLILLLGVGIGIWLKRK